MSPPSIQITKIYTINTITWGETGKKSKSQMWQTNSQLLRKFRRVVKISQGLRPCEIFATLANFGKVATATSSGFSFSFSCSKALNFYQFLHS